MQNMHFRRRLPTISAIGLLTATLGMSLPVTAGTVTFGDPVPAGLTYPDCSINEAPTGNDGGISYEWMVKMGGHDKVSFINRVGAKSYNEPLETSSTYAPPYTGWTHTSNWVALELTQRAKIKIKVERQEGVPMANSTPVTVARNKLVPALSIYSGWDNTSCEDHRYNPSGDIDWTTIKYIGNQPNKHGKDEVEYQIVLDAGNYSIAIGGAPKVLPDYSILTNCNPADPICYAYTGNHGYRVEIKTGKQ
jgi:hypothetical protein